MRSDHDITCTFESLKLSEVPNRMSEIQMDVEGEGGEGVVVDALPYIDHGQL